jgi:hypothetical protein
MGPVDDEPHGHGAVTSVRVRGPSTCELTSPEAVTRLIRDHLCLPPDHPYSCQGHDFSAVTFAGGEDLSDAMFSGGTIDFGDATFSGGLIEFGDAATFSGFLPSCHHLGSAETVTGGVISGFSWAPLV